MHESASAGQSQDSIASQPLMIVAPAAGRETKIVASIPVFVL
jgi:hypothetical protein